MAAPVIEASGHNGSTGAKDWVSIRLGLAALIVANLLIAGVLAFAAWLKSHDHLRYLLSVQEDQSLEWATFFSFVFAALLFALAARSQWRDSDTGFAGSARARRFPWFLLGVSLFSFIVAMEEISWGQRLLGYIPPTYFLANNIQQELNLHNLANASLRSLAFNAILLGYGVLLPAIARASAIRAMLARCAVVPPPLGLLPSFLVTAIAWNWYPLPYTGEWVELMMGLGFAFAAVALSVAHDGRQGRLMVALAATWGGVVGLGFAAVTASSFLPYSAPEVVAQAQTETVALMTDLAQRGSPCRGSRRLLQRVYTYVEERKAHELTRGEFAALASSGLPESRASFFLDPWNSPYWFFCSELGGWTGVVYSFGPNRRRETSDSEIRGDDIGAMVKPGSPVVVVPTSVPTSGLPAAGDP